MLNSANAHVSSWVVAFLLFALTIFFQKAGKEKLQKIFSSLLRLSYLFILITGFALFGINHQPLFLYLFKILAGLWVIGMLEMIPMRLKQGKRTKAYWIQLVLAFVIAYYLGYKLPLGHRLF